MPERSPFSLMAILRQMRPHQWVKNTLVFVPVILAHQWSDGAALALAVWAFVAFSLLASAVYTLNDMADLESDRQHPRKRHRPLASGAITRTQAVALIAALLVGASAAAWKVGSLDFLAILILYAIATSAYSFWLKRTVLADVIVLSALYTVRIVAGGIASDVAVTSWLLTFSMFFFSSLAFLKRYTELLDTIERDGHQISGRGYHVGDSEFVQMAGIALGFIAVLVFSLYLNGEEVRRLYPSPLRLWGVVPLLMYWIGRVWLKAHRGEMHDDPIVFALRDRASYLIGAGIVFILVWAAQ